MAIARIHGKLEIQLINSPYHAVAQYRRLQKAQLSNTESDVHA